MELFGQDKIVCSQRLVVIERVLRCFGAQPASIGDYKVEIQRDRKYDCSCDDERSAIVLSEEGWGSCTKENIVIMGPRRHPSRSEDKLNVTRSFVPWSKW